MQRWLVLSVLFLFSVSTLAFAVSPQGATSASCLPNQSCYSGVEFSRGLQIFFAKIFGGEEQALSSIQSEKIAELKELKDTGVSTADPVFAKQVDAVQEIQIMRKPFLNSKTVVTAKEITQAQVDANILAAVAVPKLNEVTAEKLMVVSSAGVTRVIAQTAAIPTPPNTN